MRIAITGATGFVGGTLVTLALAAGHEVRALTRRPQHPREGVTWIAGALDTTDALAALVTGADIVIHVAGITNAPDRDSFWAGNVDGTATVVAAAQAAGKPRFVHVSSLAAREPALSMYGASKAAAEDIVAASALPWSMVRPAAIYGPGELLDLFRMAARGFVLLPPAGGRASIIGVADLGRLLLALAEPEAPTQVIYEPDDGRAGGWDNAELACEVGKAVGRRVRIIHTPRLIMQALSSLDRLIRGRKALLTPDRVSYFCHPDWTIDPARRPPPVLWEPQVETAQGLAATAAWYRAQGLL
jgi:nucleoside-diphosphate-sugar epimerase